ncbi:prolyl oligopeptidase family serine peptidase [Roseateles asaccharophilus]|uniref:Dipeptidyl aminopeptidase/acylaminoacyl peptidase n=1 Tax=Roseateles asaccharophilus TaxID=582607 RepID=A0ABU2A354_9BURK|nr:prolyl oligopeptidase family serine peptidase [Roseateles asaccharophilus]MDR7331619.1 dipeptidyl aminopeptidase/acylaminoacyl peptidase [Roseateles asaccharophilus]
MTFHQLIRAASLAAALWMTGCAATAQPIQTFFKNADMGDVVLSPSGRKLALLSNQGADRVGLAVLDLSQGSQARRIAYFPDGDIRRVHWMGDDRLAFSVFRADDGPDRYGSPAALYAANSDGSSIRRLWSGHHSVLRVPAPVAGQANDRILMLAWNDETSTTPLWLDTRVGSTRRPDQLDAPPHAVGWLADSQGELRVAVTHHQNKSAAYWRAPGSRQWLQLYESDSLSVPFYIEGVDDAGSLYVTRAEGPEGYYWLSRYDFKLGKPEDRFIIRTPGFDFDGGLVQSEGQLLGLRFVVDGETTHWLDPAMKAFQDRVDQIFPGRVNRVDCRRCGAPDMVAVVRSYSDQDPGKLYLYQARPADGEKPWRPVGAVMNGVIPEQMAGMSLQRIRARDGRELPVWVTRPNAATGPRPAVVLVHGGPWLRGNAWGWHAMPQFLASRGYVVIEPEMRGSTGYGKAHFEAGFRQWGQAMQHDVADALRWAQKEGIASDKACIVGDSYGGYSTLMGLANDPALYRCGIAGFAPADLALYLQGSAWLADDIGPEVRRHSLPVMVGDASREAAMIEAQSPVKQAARIKAPVMLVYGEMDWRVPLAHGERLRKAMRDAGNEPVWVSYRDEGHGLYYLKNRVDHAQRMEAFLAEHLKP